MERSRGRRRRVAIAGLALGGWCASCGVVSSTPDAPAIAEDSTADARGDDATSDDAPDAPALDTSVPDSGRDAALDADRDVEVDATIADEGSVDAPPATPTRCPDSAPAIDAPCAGTDGAICRYPGDCGIVRRRCESGAWRAPTADPTCAPGCPREPPSGACVPDGRACDYSTCADGTVNLRAHCHAGRWAYSHALCASMSPCPAIAPAPGDPCGAPSPKCSYGLDCPQGFTELHCDVASREWVEDARVCPGIGDGCPAKEPIADATCLNPSSYTLTCQYRVDCAPGATVSRTYSCHDRVDRWRADYAPSCPPPGSGGCDVGPFCGPPGLFCDRANDCGGVDHVECGALYGRDDARSCGGGCPYARPEEGASCGAAAIGAICQYGPKDLCGGAARCEASGAFHRFVEEPGAPCGHGCVTPTTTGLYVCTCAPTSTYLCQSSSI